MFPALFPCRWLGLSLFRSCCLACKCQWSVRKLLPPLFTASHMTSTSCFPLSLQHPVSWQPSKEGDHLIGRITLSKRSAVPREAGSLLGLKVSREHFPLPLPTSYFPLPTSHFPCTHIIIFNIQSKWKKIPFNMVVFTSLCRWWGGRWQRRGDLGLSLLKSKRAAWPTWWDTSEQVQIEPLISTYWSKLTFWRLNWNVVLSGNLRKTRHLSQNVSL